MRVIYNACYGGFGLSDKALTLYNDYRKDAGLPVVKWCVEIKPRHDPLLLAVIDQLGHDANGDFSELKIKEIPPEYTNCYEIREYDGWERVVCNPARLVEYRLTGTDVKALTDTECRTLLEELTTILG